MYDCKSYFVTGPYFAACADLTGAIGAYYNAIGQIDQGLFDTSFVSATSLVSGLIAKSFGAQLASINVSDGYGQAVNGAASGYADSMHGISTTYAQAGIDIGDTYAKGVIDAKVSYMKSMNSAIKEKAKADAAATKEYRTQSLELSHDMANDYLSARKEHYNGCMYSLSYELWFSDNYGHDGCFHYDNHDGDFDIWICGHMPEIQKIGRTYTATTLKNSLTYVKKTADTEKTYANTVAGLAKTALEKALDAEKMAAENEHDAVESYCDAVQEAAVAANDALIEIAENADPTADIVAYLQGMAEAEAAAEVARIQALGVFQIAQREEYLDSLDIGDPRYEAALADLTWTQTTVATRNSYYTQLSAASVQHLTTTLNTMAAYNSAQLQSRGARQQQQMQCQFAYDNSRRAVDWSFASTERQLRHDYETAMLNASYDEYVNNANCKAELTGNLSANFGYQYDALQSSNADDSSLSGMFESLVASVAVAEAQNQVLFNAFQREQGAIRSALQSQAATQFNNGNAANEIALQTAISGGDVQYLSQYYSIEAAALVADASAYAAYLAAMETAQQEFTEEQCRLEGLLLESLDTGVNIVDTGTTSLQFQVCFRAKTPVQMAEDFTKPIEEIQPDDLVKKVDQHDPTGEIKIGRVVRVFHNAPQPLWILQFGETELGVTKEHPFFVYDKGWVQAENLELGDVCRSVADTKIILTSKVFDATPVPVYNFEVEGGHTYFVGESKERSVLVHNICNGMCQYGKYCGDYWHGVGQVGLGVGDSIIAIPVGAWNAVSDIPGTASGLWNAVRHPIQTAYAVGTGMYDQAGTLRGQGVFLGDAMMTAVGVGGAKKASDTIKGIKVAKEGERVKALGFDLHTKTYRPAEARVAPLIEKERKVKLERRKSTEKGDWIDQYGTIYDHIGGNPNGPTDMEHFFKKLDDHKAKCDVVVIDVKEFTPEQIKEILDRVKDWPNPPIIFE